MPNIYSYTGSREGADFSPLQLVIFSHEFIENEKPLKLILNYIAFELSHAHRARLFTDGIHLIIWDQELPVGDIVHTRDLLPQAAF